jgi:hypothetical protein
MQSESNFPFGGRDMLYWKMTGCIGKIAPVGTKGTAVKNKPWGG